MDQQEPRFYNYKSLSEYTGISLNTLYSMVFRKKIPCLRISTRYVLFDRMEIAKWIHDHGQPVEPSDDQ